MKRNLKNIISGFAVGVMMLTNVISPIVTAYNANSASTSFKMPDHAVTLKATSKGNPYKVSFNANPGSDTINPVNGTMTDQNFIYGTAQNLTGNKYTRVGYTFAGWSTGSAVVYADGQSVNNLTTTSGGTVTMYAKWIAKTGINYTVNHYLMDADGNWPTTPITVTYTGTTYDVVTGARRNDTGMTLSGSLQSAHLKGDGSTVFNYYYTRDQKNLTVNAGRGVASVSGGGLKYYNQSVTVSATLKTGYENLTWTGDKTVATFNMPNSNVTMTANATPKDYTITVDVGSGTMSGGNTIHYNVEDVATGFTLPDPTRTGYDFVGWSGSITSGTTSTGYTLPAGTYGNQNLEAVWSARSDIVYKVHHYIEAVESNTYAQSGATEEFRDGTADATLILANLKHDVDGDCVTYTGGSLVVSTSGLTSATPTVTIMPDGSTEVYLYYSRNEYILTLTHDTGISTVATADTYKCGATVNITATPKAGYGFKSWDVISPAEWTPSS